MSVSMLSIGSGAATPVNVVNLSIAFMLSLDGTSSRGAKRRGDPGERRAPDDSWIASLRSQ
jgi:hypothetical protein